jgi:methylated-DNA-[protein]-cysteine S-methyltransferase
MASDFALRCYEFLKCVPSGRVTTYRELAHALGTRGYRAIGAVLNRNPFAPEVPCHRVVCSDGSLGGFAWGVEKKISLLHSEGITIANGRISEFSNVIFKSDEFKLS